MRGETFAIQMKRMETRFGARAFDKEFVDLVWREVSTMSDEGFIQAVDAWIGSRPSNRPPLIADYREARVAEEKRKFQSEVAGACKTLETKAPEEMKRHARNLLSKEFGAVESVIDAVEIARIRLLTKTSGGSGI